MNYRSETQHGAHESRRTCRYTGVSSADDLTDLDEAASRATAGDAQAFAALFRQLQPRLLRFLRSQVGAMADDVAAETWMSAARSMRTFHGSGSDFRAWLFTIARRRVVDHHRFNGRRATTFQPTMELISPTAPPEERVVAGLSGQAAAELVVATLPRDQAEVVLLRVLGDLEVDEVAAIVGRSPNWVRVTHHRALKRLAEHFHRELDVIPVRPSTISNTCPSPATMKVRQSSRPSSAPCAVPANLMS